MTNTALLPGQRPRITSIDVLRGLVMIIMALDHVRDFFHETAMTQDPLNLSTTSTSLFFTRWITHFCAPIFVFLSGVSAFISGQRKTTKELSVFLCKRGIWLILVELVIVSLGITFNPLYNVLILQVIWAIGWSMLLLGLLLRTSMGWIVGVGLLLVFGHNILDFFPELRSSRIMELLLTSSGAVWDMGSGYFVMVAYAVLPWTGIMLLGFAFGKIYSERFTTEERRRWLLIAGAGLLLLFVVIRFVNLYGDPAPWSRQSSGWFSFLSFLNVTKYPVSLQYTCLTVGTGIILLRLFDGGVRGWQRVLIVYGKVPFFYYILHFYLIHIICVLLFFATGNGVDQIVDMNSPFLFRPVQWGFGLPVVYLIWLIVVASLYLPCRWFAGVKSRRRDWWLSYL